MTLIEIAAKLNKACQPDITYRLAPMVVQALMGEGPLTPKFLSGYQGLGKTNFVENFLYGDILANFGWFFVPIPVGCTAAQLVAIVVKYCGEYDERSVLFFADEIHALPPGAKNFLKSVTETNGKVKAMKLPSGKTECDVVIDPARHWFFGASNEAVKDGALVGGGGRFEELRFVPYNAEGKRSIFDSLQKLYAPGVKMSDDTKNIALAQCRPFARAIKNLLVALNNGAAWGFNLNTKEGMAQALRKAGYFPGGWTSDHISVMRALCASGTDGLQVTEIGQKALAGADMKSTQAILGEMVQGGMVLTTRAGKKGATPECGAYLQSLDEKAKAARARRLAKPVPVAEPAADTSISLNTSY